MRLKNRSDKCLPSITEVQLLLPQSGGMDRMICGSVFHPCFTEVPTVVYNYYGLLFFMSCMFLFVWVCFIYHLWTLHSALHGDTWMRSEQWSPDGPGSALHGQGDLLSGLPPPTHLSTAETLISESGRAQLSCGRKESRWTQRHLQCTYTQEMSCKLHCTKWKWRSVRLAQVHYDFFGDERRKLSSALSWWGTLHHNHHLFLMLYF